MRSSFFVVLYGLIGLQCATTPHSQPSDLNQKIENPVLGNNGKKELDISKKLNAINFWYNYLVVKREKGPAYVFETEVYSERTISGYSHQEFEEFSKDKSLIVGQGNFSSSNYFVIEERGAGNYFALDENNFSYPFDNAFIKENFDFVKSFLIRERIPYSKVFLQIPLRRIITRDLVANAAQGQAVIFDLEKKYFRFNTSAASLIKSEKFDPSFDIEDLPVKLISEIKLSFQEIKKWVPSSYQLKISNSELKIGDPAAPGFLMDEEFSSKKLFLYNLNGDVLMSSLLVRAIIVEAISNHASHVLDQAKTNYELRRPVRILKLPYLQSIAFENSKEKLEWIEREQSNLWTESARQKFIREKGHDIEAAYVGIFRDLRATVSFLFLHELAHIYLDEIFDEKRCDCHAYKILREKSEYPELGIFDNLLVGAFKNNLGRYWLSNDGSKLNKKDSVTINEIFERSDRLEKIKNFEEKGILPLNFDCDTLSF